MVKLNIRGQEVDIDEKCVDLVNYFNSIGLDTRFCCEGHNEVDTFHIMFEDYISDEKIINFINRYSSKYDHTPFCGRFQKWCRKMSGNIVFNWEYTAKKQEHAIFDYEQMAR